MSSRGRSDKVLEKSKSKSKSRSGSSSSTHSNSSDGSSLTYALVKCMTGADKGKHDVIDTRWILDRHYDEGDSVAVEWRRGKRPELGWSVFDAIVIAISEDKDELVSRLENLTGVGSDDGSDGDKETNGADAPASPRHPPQHHRNPSMSNLMKALRDFVGTSSSPGPSDPTCSERVLVGKTLWVTKSAYNQAMAAPTPGRMVRPLLRQAFSRSRLVKSSYAGQKRKRPNGDIEVKPGLKKYRKMADIQDKVLERFPHVSQALFGSIVNSHLGEKQNTLTEVQYVTDSEDEL